MNLGFSVSLKIQAQLQTLVSAVPRAWSGVVTQARAFGLQILQSPQNYFFMLIVT